MNYTFTTDWFSHNIPHWERWFSPYAGKSDLNFLEVGSFEGRSAIWFLEHVLTDPSSRLTCVDPFDTRFVWQGETYGELEAEQHFRHNLEISGKRHQVTVHKGYSQAVLRTLGQDAYDVIYIDGSHLAADALHDAVLAYTLLKKDGLLLFDDYHYPLPGATKWEKPRMGLDAFMRVYEGRVLVREKGYQLLLQKCGEQTDMRRYMAGEG